MTELALCGPARGHLEPELEIQAIRLVPVIRGLSEQTRDILYHWVAGYSDSAIPKEMDAKLTAQQVRDRITRTCNGFELSVDWNSKLGKSIIERAVTLSDDPNFMLPVTDTRSATGSKTTGSAPTPANDTARATGPTTPVQPPKPDVAPAAGPAQTPSVVSDDVKRIAHLIAETPKTSRNRRLFRVLQGIAKGESKKDIAKSEGAPVQSIDTLISITCRDFAVPRHGPKNWYDLDVLAQAYVYYRDVLKGPEPEPAPHPPAGDARTTTAEPAPVPVRQPVVVVRTDVAYDVATDIEKSAVLRPSSSKYGELRARAKRLGYEHAYTHELVHPSGKISSEVWVKRKKPA